MACRCMHLELHKKQEPSPKRKEKRTAAAHYHAPGSQLLAGGQYKMHSGRAKLAAAPKCTQGKYVTSALECKCPTMTKGRNRCK